MASYEIKQSSTAYPLVFLLVSSTDHITGLTGATVTVTISKNGGGFASPTGAVTEIANGWYKVAGNATDTGSLGPLILHASATGADPVDMLFEVVAYDPQDAVRLGMTAIPNTACTTNASLITSGTGTDQLSVSGGKTLLQATQTGVTIPTVTTVGTTTTLATLPAVPTDWLTGAGVKADAVTKIQTGLATPTNITAGTIANVTNPVSITGDLSATMKASVTTAATAATPTAAAVTGNVGGNVAGLVGGVVASVTVGTNLDKTGYLLTSAYDDAKTAAQPGDDMGLTTAGVDSIFTRDLSQIVGEASRSLLNGVRFLRNKFQVLAGILTVYKEDDTTPAWTGTVTTDAAADPITGNDPS